MNIVQYNNKKDFLDVVNTVEFHPKDNEEAVALKYQSVKVMYNITRNPFSKYWIVYGGTKNLPLCTIELARDGSLNYFVTTNLTATMIPELLRTLKVLANETLEKVDVIFTATLNTYDEANRFNELIGFKKYSIGPKFTTWYMEKQ